MDVAPACQINYSIPIALILFNSVLYDTPSISAARILFHLHSRGIQRRVFVAVLVSIIVPVSYPCHNSVLMSVLRLKSVVWKEGRHYVAQCLNVDVSSFGKNKKQALANLQEALELYFQDEAGSKFTPVERPELIPLSISRA